jgi:cellulose synthase/poly-beta-1,6-N-acetylglucosamine synthase-like glycosyltransferase
MFASIQEGDLLFAPLQAFFYLSLAGAFPFTISRWLGLINTIRVTFFGGTIFQMPGVSQAGVIARGDEPHVTVQICSYNEGSVVIETIAKACSMRWPKDKLTIQICDDSNDLESILHIKESVTYWKQRGFDIARLTRRGRVGYKAGSLRHHFSKVKGKFVAFLDADHHVEADFLQNAMRYFFDLAGKVRQDLALVQLPWGYYNIHQNILTECGEYYFTISKRQN